MMRIYIDWLDNLPFAAVVANEEGIIQAYNKPCGQICGKAINGDDDRLDWLFLEWKALSNDVALAVCDNRHFVVFNKKITWQSQELFLYLLADDSQIYQLKQQIGELYKTNKELDAIIESSYDGIYITDVYGKTLRTNSAIERITGIPKKYYIGKNIAYLVNRGIANESVTFKVLEQKEPASVIYKSASGKETLITGSPVFNDEGDVEKVVTNIRDLSELNTLRNELDKVRQLNSKYKEELDKLKAKAPKNDGFIVESSEMKVIYEMCERITNVDATVLILGETGVGKDVLARHIYRTGNRSGSGDFIKINCGAIPHELLESELFGYEAGAFTGAGKAGKAGLFELAHRGVLFLDEVGELPAALQVKLLRAIQDKQIQRVGATKLKNIDVRVVAATNRNLREMVSQGTFREDLFYRLNVLPILIPPLRERRDEILPLIHHFLESFNKKYDISKQFDSGLKEFFYHYSWPGNVRELANLVERLILTVMAKVITIDDLPIEYRETKETAEKNARYTKEVVTLKEAVERAERELLSLAIKKLPSTYRIAEALGTSQPTIVRKLKKYNL
jgi:PAS domain S-box-containing protein/TyrR family helix-turn-helix protein